MAASVVVKEDPSQMVQAQLAQLVPVPPITGPPVHGISPWQYVVQMVLDDVNQDNQGLMNSLMEVVSELLQHFTAFTVKIRHQCLPGEEFSTAKYPLIQSLLKIDHHEPQVYLNSSIDLTQMLRNEMTKTEQQPFNWETPQIIIKEQPASQQTKTPHIYHGPMLITSDPFQYEVVKSTDGDGLQTSIPKAIISNAGRKRSRPKTASMDKPTRTPKPPNMTKIAAEAIMDSQDYRLTFEQLKAAIVSKHSCFNKPVPAPSKPSRLTGWHYTLHSTLRDNDLFVQVGEDGEKEEKKRNMLDRLKCWTLAKDPKDVTAILSETKKRVRKFTKDDWAWKPFFPVDVNTWTEIRRGKRPAQCHKCGKLYISSTPEPLITHWKKNNCDKSIRQNQENLMTKEVIGETLNGENGRRFMCTHSDCSDSQQTFCTRQAVQRHFNRLHKGSYDGKIWECSQCPEIFLVQFLLTEHIKEAHTDEKWPCCYCGKMLESKKHRYSHERVTCMMNPKAVEKHKQTVTCEFCGLTMKRNRYHNHKKTYCQGIKREHEEKYSCEICGKEFNSKGKVKEHMSTHNDKPDPKFQCPICHKFMKQHNSFKKHMVNVHKQSHTCDICNMTFHDAEYLKRHKIFKHELANI